ncbi:transcriptional regulator ATRX homolog [Hetaerina americana]|uniref:transcriptional regulator ATRX homolog n=1 Tax=Hetaerina americana TaxID=62018 RepID=UPI003A7F1804
MIQLFRNCPKTPDVKGSQQKELVTPTGRALNDSQLSAGSIGHRRVNHPTPNSSQLLSSQSSSVMMMALSPRSKLFRLQRKRNVGLWVQCTNKSCSKWRYLPSTRDPTEVPDNWQCFMNHDMKYASCSAPEKGPTPVEEEDLIHNIYTAGSVVWGHLAGYPWWPAIVDDDPDVEQYYWVTETCDIPTHYNVTFFDDKPVTRAWLTPGAITKYSQPDKNKDVFKMSAHGNDYSRRIEVAKRQAEEALKLSVDERLKKFSFVARYKGPIGKKRYPSDSEDDEVIKKSMKRAGKVRRADKTVSEEDPIIDFEASLEIVKEVNQVLNELSASEFDEDEESGKGHSNTKSSGMAKSKKEKESNPDRKHEGLKRKEIEQKDKMKKGKKSSEERSEIKEVDRVNDKSNKDLINKIKLKENKKKNKEIKRDKKKSKEIKDNDVDKVRKDKKKTRETKKNMTINIDIDAAAKKTKRGQKEGVNTVIRGVGVPSKTSFKNGLGGYKPETNRNDGQSSSTGKSQEGKTKKKNDGRAKKETNKSETPKYESGDEVSSGESDVVRSRSDDECSSVERNDKSSSDAEDSSDEELIECKNVGDRREEDATSLPVKEMDVGHILVEDSEYDGTEAGDCLPLPSPVPSTTCGRSSADLFERQLDNVDQVSAGSQCSADFEVEE